MKVQKMPVTITFEIPDEIVNNFRDLEEMKNTAFQDFIIEERQRGNISMGKTVEILGKDYSEVVSLLGKYRFPVCNLSRKELEEGSNNLKEFMQRKRTFHKK